MRRQLWYWIVWVIKQIWIHCRTCEYPTGHDRISSSVRCFFLTTVQDPSKENRVEYSQTHQSVSGDVDFSIIKSIIKLHMSALNQFKSSANMHRFKFQKTLHKLVQQACRNLTNNTFDICKIFRFSIYIICWKH